MALARMLRLFIVALIIAVLLPFDSSASAGPPDATGTAPASQSTPSGDGAKDSAVPSTQHVDFINCAVEKQVLPECLKLLRAQFLYEEAKLNIITATFDAQRRSSYVVLGLVVLVTLAGLGFAGYQLIRGASGSNSKESASTLEWSATGLKIASSVVGLFVMGFSLAFLSIYIHEVYRIDVIQLSNSNSAIQGLRENGLKPIKRYSGDNNIATTTTSQ